MRLSTRLTLAMVSLVLVTTAVLGYLNYSNVVELVRPRALAQLRSHAQLNAMMMDAALRSTRADAVSAQESAALRELLALRHRMPDTIDQQLPGWRKRIEDRFAAELAAKPNSVILRILAPEDGREMVRVDRYAANGATRVVPAAQLGPRGDRAFFQQGIALKPGEAAITPIELNKVPAVSGPPHVPTAHTLAPIDAADGTRLGLLVINTSLHQLFAGIRASSDGTNAIYIINDAGDYLLHPDPAREFGFSRGAPVRIQDEFPAFAALLDGTQDDPRILANQAGERFGIGWHWIRLADGPRVAVVEMRPYSSLTMVQNALRNSTIAGGAAALLIALLMAIPLARSLTRPVVRITESIDAFSSGGQPIEVKPGGGYEIDVLAQALTRMTSESKRKTAALAEEADERMRLAGVLQNTIDSMVDPVLVADRRGMVMITNPAARKLFGTLSGVGIRNTTRSFDRFYPDGAALPPDESPLLRAYHGETIENFEFMVQPIGSTWRACLIANGRPLRNETGEIQGAVMVYHDITKTKQVEEALRRSEQMARAIVDTALDAFVQVDAAGTVTEWSPHAELMFGWPRSETIGRDVFQLIIPPEKLPEWSESFVQFTSALGRKDSGFRVEIEAIRRDGTSIPIEVAMAALYQDGSFVINAFLRDLTEKIAFEEQLRQSQKMESIGQLTGGIAHDFNNMLTVITGTIDIISDGVAEQPHLAAIAKLISEAADRGAELTRLLLAFARKQPLRPDETDLNALVAGLQSLLRPTLGEQIEIDTVLATDTWPVYVDRGQLESALVNLAVNARDAMPKGGKLTVETGNIIVDAEFAKRLGNITPGSYVLIAISDSGSGIPEAIRGKVFDPFFTTKEVGKGTGLGLSMVYGFIKQSGGHITLYSEEGLGTTFRLYLPRAVAEVESDEPTAAEESTVGGNETILVVEDDAMVRSYVNAQLKSLGYTTLSVGNAAAALSICDSDAHFDLLFTDVVMPGTMNGVQLVTEMERRRPGLKVLFTSGYSENALIHNDRIDSDILLLSKPYRRADLARMVRRALSDVDRPTPGDVGETTDPPKAAARTRQG